jgi:hypothetical protein
MEYSRALDQISEIHQHLAKGEIYRGYHPLPVALTGLCGLAGILLQPHVLSADDALGFVAFWITLAVVSCVLCGGAIVRNYVVRDDAFARRKTRQVVGQLLPCLVAGAAVTAGLVWVDPKQIAFLPGLWAVVFSLGIFASRPYLPRSIGWVGLFYLGAGAALLLLARDNWSLEPWGVGLTFGLGQLAAALVLYTNKERKEHA